MQEYNNIVSEYSEYFFENFKGGRGGGKRKKGIAKDDKDRVKENITTVIFFAIFAFIYYIYISYPKKTTKAVLKRYDAYNYMNDYIYLAIAFIVFVLLYMIVTYVYNHLDTSVVNNK